MKRYADDYETIMETDKWGREKKVAVYRGRYYEIDAEENEIIRFRQNSLILICGIIVLHIAGGFIGNPGMYAFYVALPYVFIFLPLYLMIAGGLRLPGEKRKLRRDEIGLSFERIRKANLFSLILLGVVLFGEVVFLIRFASEGISQEVLFIGIELLVLIGAYFFYRIQRSMQGKISLEE
jgi:hypothetical protein